MYYVVDHVITKKPRSIDSYEKEFGNTIVGGLISDC